VLVSRLAVGSSASKTAHAAFGEGSIAKLEASPLVKLLVTDRVESQLVDLGSRVEVVSVAGLFAEAIRRGRQGEHEQSLSLRSTAGIGRRTGRVWLRYR
jgi:phosphoribosylpyrophosphate synthetase